MQDSPNETKRLPPQGDYSNAPMNMRRFVEGKMLRQGIIEGNEQTTANVAQLIKYIQSNRFKDDIDAQIKNFMQTSQFKNMIKLIVSNDNENESGETEG
jgi:hypothetical protein